MTAAVEVVEPRPRSRGRLHLLAFLVALPGGVLLLQRTEGARSTAAAAVYACSVVATFGVSAAYHNIRWSSGARAMMQRLDHATIYVMIAGTYAPVCIVALPHRWGIPLLATVGAGSLVGIASKLLYFDGLGRHATVLYLLLGWAAVAAGPTLSRVLSPGQLTLLVLGGLAYTVGFPVLAMRRPNPWPTVFGYHEIWHIFTVLAAALHYSAVATIVT